MNRLYYHYFYFSLLSKQGRGKCVEFLLTYVATMLFSVNMEMYVFYGYEFDNSFLHAIYLGINAYECSRKNWKTYDKIFIQCCKIVGNFINWENEK